MADRVIPICVCAILLMLAIQQCHAECQIYQETHRNCCPGRFADNLSVCHYCKKGFYQVNAGQFHCEWTPPNTYIDKIGQKRWKDCPAGTSTRGNPLSDNVKDCLKCPADTYLSTEDKIYDRRCTPCGIAKGPYPKQRTSEPGSSSPADCHVQCPHGQYFRTKHGICFYCQPGSYSDNGLQADGACKPCVAGTYEDAVLSRGCKRCWPGTYSSARSDHCPLCKPGTYSNEYRAVRCHLCPFGTTTAIHGSITVDDCKPELGYLGCYEDEWSRDLGAHTYVSDLMTTERCLNFCEEENYPYAGLQNGNECRCDYKYGLYNKIDDSRCSVLCIGGGGSCGGVWANAIYGIVKL